MVDWEYRAWHPDFQDLIPSSMKPWILYALISMIFAGFTSVIAKLGLSGISAELGLAIRTCFVFVFVVAFVVVCVCVRVCACARVRVRVRLRVREG